MSFADLLEKRRTIYGLGNELPVSESEIESLVASVLVS